MKKVIYMIITALLSISTVVSAQRGACGSYLYQQNMAQKFPQLQKRMSVVSNFDSLAAKVAQFKTTITIPVVVHIVYKTEEQRKAGGQVDKQMQILNQDFAGTNADISQVPEGFQAVLAQGASIQFKVASVVETQSTKDVFYMEAEEIKTASGAEVSSQFPTSRYLHIWVGNIAYQSEGDLLGYATFPGQAAHHLDGVAIYYKAFGTPGAMAAFNGGRTTTHEVGHWLGLRHIWGDKNDCTGDDGIKDTPKQATSNYDCPKYPHKTAACNETVHGEMFMNYMDYVNDPCMYMFTKNQSQKMLSNFLPGGYRSGFVVKETANSSVWSDAMQKEQTRRPDIESPSENTVTVKNIQDSKRYEFVYTNMATGEVKSRKSSTPVVSVEGLDAGQLYEISVSPIGRPELQNSILIQPK